MRIASSSPTSLVARLVFALIFAGLTVAGTQAQGPAVPSLLLPAPASARVPAAVSSRIDTLQARPVQANLTALAADSFDVEVAPGRIVRAVLDRRESSGIGAQTWVGHVAGEPLSTVTLVAMNGVVQGSVRLLDASYSLETGPGNVLVMRQVDADAVGAGLEPIQVDVPPVAGDAPPVAGDDGSTFDILVFYNETARTAAGGDTQAQTRIALGVSETNTAYANSGIAPRLRLVGAEFLSYTEAGNLSTDLSRLQGTADGSLDSVHARRDQLGADLVMLVVGNTAGGACGVGYIMTALSNGFASYAFTVTAYPCISPNYTFAHELGHNMGSAHAPEDGAGQGSLYAYSFGYKQPSNLFRTVMAYDCVGGCPRILYFSNPNVSYNSNATGTAVQHDNAHSINNAANTIANWRQTVGSGSAPTISAIANVTINEDAATSPIAFTVGDVETAAGNLTVTASSNNTGLVPNTVGALALGGSGASRSLVVTPVANQSGSAVITVTVSDGTFSSSRTFTLTVNTVNDTPVIAGITGKTTAEDTPLAVTVSLSDPDTAVGSLVLQASSSNGALVPSASIALSGNGSTRTATITPAPEASGATTITLTVNDGSTSSSTSFTLTVTGVDDAPAFAPATPTAVSSLVSTPTAFTVTVNDTDTTGASLTLAAVTTNAALLTSGGIAVTPLSSTATSSTFSVTLTPVTGALGTGGVTLTASDGTTPASRSVALTITSTPGPPDPPVALVSTVTGAALQLSWSAAPTGTTPTSYEVSIGTGPGLTTLPVQTTSATTVSVAVPPGATYYWRVRAVNSHGTSLASAESVVTITVFDPKPGAPPQFDAFFNGRTVTVNWTAPLTGDPVTDYVIEGGSAPGLANYGTVHMGTATSFTASGVPDGTFWLRVRGTNAAGAGPNSAELALVMRPSGGCVGLPMAPTFATPAVTGNAVTLSWAAPTAGATPVSYVLVAGWAPGTSDVAVLDLGSPATSVSGMVPGGSYFVRMAARSACGVGPASNEQLLVVGAGTDRQ